ncbi:MAG: DMT family transporter [Flavobacteriales bacterium]
MNSKIKGILLLLFLGAVWGSSFLFMKLGMEPSAGHRSLSHAQVAGLRMLVAAGVMLPFALKRIHILWSKDLPFLLTVGLCGNFIPSYLFTYAGTVLSSGFCGILNSFTPIFTVLISVLAFKTRIHSLQVLGILVGSYGIFFLVRSGKELTLENSPMHIGAVLLATLLYGISVNTIRHKLNHVSPLEVTSLGLLCILPFTLISFFVEGTYTSLRNDTYGLEALGYVFILGFMSTAVSNIYFNRLIKMTSAIFASSVTYLIPVFAVWFGFLLNESVSLMQLTAMAVLLLGVFLVNFHETLLRFFRKKNIE